MWNHVNAAPPPAVRRGASLLKFLLEDARLRNEGRRHDPANISANSMPICMYNSPHYFLRIEHTDRSPKYKCTMSSCTTWWMTCSAQSRKTAARRCRSRGWRDQYRRNNDREGHRGRETQLPNQLPPTSRDVFLHCRSFEKAGCGQLTQRGRNHFFFNIRPSRVQEFSDFTGSAFPFASHPHIACDSIQTMSCARFLVKNEQLIINLPRY